MTARRFPPPWSAEVTPNCFIVRDADGQQLAYVYYESEPGRRSAAKLLSKDAADCGEYCGKNSGRGFDLHAISDLWIKHRDLCCRSAF